MQKPQIKTLKDVISTRYFFFGLFFDLDLFLAISIGAFRVHPGNECLLTVVIIRLFISFVDFAIISRMNHLSPLLHSLRGMDAKKIQPIMYYNTYPFSQRESCLT